MRNFKTEGIIIKRRNYKDSDRILTVLTKTNGKIYVKAAGVRKITSRRAGHIEPINHSMLSLYQGNAFPILTEAETINNFSEIKSDLESVGHALHLCELVDGLCPENQENMRIFFLLKNALDKLCLVDVDQKTIINEFEMQLLTILGYWNNASFATLDTENFIENILERKLRSRNIFVKMQ
ncbi:MAG TPA: DNA repair protein RecO [Candidatus Limnocylindrales bacterium]|nr:DNA repair protein RecO [Candidatus Limnocylindrales bacterium]